MEDVAIRFVENLIDRLSGPMHFRILLQPSVALYFGIRDGLADARSGNSPYFWSVFSDPGQRRYLLREGWRSIAKVFIIALLLDVIYQIMVLEFVYPLEALVTAFFLAIVPYVVIRGPVTRLAGKKKNTRLPGKSGKEP